MVLVKHSIPFILYFHLKHTGRNLPSQPSDCTAAIQNFGIILMNFKENTKITSLIQKRQTRTNFDLNPEALGGNVFVANCF